MEGVGDSGSIKKGLEDPRWSLEDVSEAGEGSLNGYLLRE